MRKPVYTLFALFLSLAALLLLVACPTDTEQHETVLDVPIDENNDSLLTFDTLIIKVYSRDSAFVQEVFHGKVTDPKKLIGLQLDPRVGKEFTVSITGYKGGKLGMHREVTILNLKPSGIKDMPIKDTVQIDPLIPEILTPSDTSVAEGDTLRFRVGIRNPWNGPASLTLKEGPPGSTLDTVGTASQYAYFTFTPTHDQGRSAAYAVTFLYASADRRIEKIMSLKVRSVNRPPKLSPIADQKVKENEALTFKVEATDPDGDSLMVTASNLPAGAEFTAGVFTWIAKIGQAGNHSIKLKAFDGRDSDFVAVLITVGDVEPPPPLTLELTSPAGDTSVNTTPITLHYKVNGTPLQKQLPLKEGKNRIFLDTTVAGRTAFDTILIILDMVPPGAPKVKGLTPVNTRTPTWTWTSGGGGNGAYRYRVDSEDMAGAILLLDTFYTAPKDLEPGTHTLFVQERDEAGNWSATGRHAIRIDTTRPTPPIVTVSPASPTNETRPTWSWSVTGDDLAGLFRYKLNSPDVHSGATETQTLNFRPEEKDALQEGPNTLYVQQQDSAGNWSLSGSYTVMVDLTPPEAPKVTATQSSPTNNQMPEWTWTSGSGGAKLYRFKLNDSVLTTGSLSGSMNSFVPDSALKEGVQVLYVQQQDSAGNWSKSGRASVQIDLTPPNAPIFSLKPLSPLNSLKPTWTWSSGGNGGIGSYRFRLDDTVWSGATLTTDPQFIPSQALSEAPHTLYVQERDSAGNWSKTAKKELVLALRGYVGNAGFSPGEANFISLAISKNSVPYVAFSDKTNENRATVMRLNGATWETVGIPGFSPGNAGSISLALSSADVPYVAFTDWANGGTAKVMRLSGAAWLPVGKTEVSSGMADAISLSMGSNDVPYVAFRDDSNDNKATVMRLNDTAWKPVGSVGFSAGSASNIKLVHSSTGVPYVAFGDEANEQKATVMRFNGTAWEAVGGAGFTAGGVGNLSLALDSAGSPYLAFIDWDDNSKVTVMEFSGSSWKTVGEAAVSSGMADFPSLALSSTGLPVVAFKDYGNGFKATVRRFNGAAWETVGNAGFSAGVVYFPSMVLTSTDVPYVGYQDEAIAGKTAVMKVSFDP